MKTFTFPKEAVPLTTFILASCLFKRLLNFYTVVCMPCIFISNTF